MSELKEAKKKKVVATLKMTFFCPKKQKKNIPVGPQTVKNNPKIKSKSDVRIEGNKENKSCSTTRVDPKTFAEPYPNSKNSPLGPQKVNNYTKNKSNSNVRIERNIENVSCSTT